MSNFTQITLDVEEQMLLPAQVTVRREKKTSAWSRAWKVCGVLLAVALCAAAAVCFTLNKQSHGKGDETDEIKHTLRQLSGKSKDAIHLSGDFNPEVSNTSVEWRDDEDQSFASGELKLAGNEIHIPRNGFYFVYSQASYRVSCTSEPGEEPAVVHLSHQVSRWSDSYDSYKPLLSAVRSACISAPTRQDNWFSAVYLGAVFNLQAGDRLRTDMDINKLSDVEAEDGKTFFGAFSL